MTRNPNRAITKGKILTDVEKKSLNPLSEVNIKNKNKNKNGLRQWLINFLK
jgi:hypothetical protein